MSTLAPMDATTIIAAIGLIFAAIAAWSAWRTVRLTFQIQHEADLRRLIGALISIKYVAEPPGVLTKLEVQDRYREALAELDRALALAVSVKGTWAAGGEELQPLLDNLKEADPINQRPKIATDAERARLLLSSQPPPKLMPKWWRRLVYRTARARALRRGQEEGDRSTRSTTGERRSD